MGKIGDGYGSEFHLKQYLDSNQVELTSRVADASGASAVTWINAVGPKGTPVEWKGVDFVRSQAVQEAWRGFWPRAGNRQNWDAVGLATINGRHEWLLVEAKAHVGELRSDCAASGDGRRLIEARLSEAKRQLRVSAERDWMRGYYQLCNRIAVLEFLRSQDTAARLVFLYFIGDARRSVECPQSPAEWSAALAAQDDHVGLPKEHEIQRLIHKVFVPVMRSEPTRAIGRTNES